VLTVADLIRLNARRNASGDAVVDGTRTLSHTELAHRSWALARGLLELGVQPGETVGVLTGTSVFSAETFLGTVAAGAVHAPYNFRWATPELVHGVNESRARVVLVEQEFEEAFVAARDTGELEHVEHVLVQGDQLERHLRPGGPPDVTIGVDDPACLLFTGGTTGFSKGVLLSHRAGMTNSLNEIIDCRIAAEPDDRALITTPMFHAAALLCWFLPHYTTGAATVFMRTFDNDIVADVVDRERVTNAFMIPNMIRRLLQADVFTTAGFQQHFRALHSGGGLLRMPDKRAVAEVLPDIDVYFRYGLTEAGPMVTRLLPDDTMREELDGSIGQEYLLTEVELLDAEDQLVGPDELGEICVRGSNVMTGYFNRPAEALRGGWLHTGDLGVRDEAGYVFFRDRAKDMIKSGGENVYAAEIEQLLYAHPSIMEAGVIGVASEAWDEEVRAVVVARGDAGVSEADLRTYLREHLAAYKIPKQIAFIDAEQMPINPSGKVVKRDLKQVMGW
jgi:acyl-CoA synthetase (AMP-forming)/AMP-acid ligase II